MPATRTAWKFPPARRASRPAPAERPSLLDHPAALAAIALAAALVLKALGGGLTHAAPTFVA